MPPVGDFRVQLTASRFQLNATQLRRNQNSEWVPEEHTQGRLVRVVLPQNFDERHFRVFSMAPYIPGAGSDEVLFQDRDVPESAIYNSRAENTMRKATRVFRTGRWCSYRRRAERLRDRRTCHSTNHEQIEGRDPRSVIAQECLPTLGGRALPRGHVPRHG